MSAKTKAPEFRLEAPAELMLPTFPGELQGYDPGEEPGYRCAWLQHWQVPDSEHPASRVKVIPPVRWRVNGGGPDVRLFPKEYLLAAVRDIAQRGIEDISQEAAKLALDTEQGGWDARAWNVIEFVRHAQHARFSRHNKVYRSALLRIPPDMKDRVRDAEPQKPTAPHERTNPPEGRPLF